MKDRIACKCCYNKNRRKNNNNTIIQNQQPKIDNINNNDNNPSVSAYEKHRCVIIGPSNVGKTLYMLKMLEKKQVTKDQSDHPINIRIMRQVMKLNQ